jgi:Mce-associated membrane protein
VDRDVQRILDNATGGFYDDALSTTTTNAGQPISPPRAWRLLITVRKVGEDYKASNVEFVP